MPKHSSINLYVHRNQKARLDGQPRTSTSTLTQLLNYVCTHMHTRIYIHTQSLTHTNTDIIPIHTHTHFTQNTCTHTHTHKQKHFTHKYTPTHIAWPILRDNQSPGNREPKSIASASFPTELKPFLLIVAFCRDPLKVMLYDTHGEDDININEEIAKRLQTEGHSIDMTQFSPTTDSTSDGSGAASLPPSTTPAARERAVEELQAVTKRLTVTDEASRTSGVAVNDVAADAATTGGRGAERSPETVPTNADSLKSSSLSSPSVGSQSSKPADSTVLAPPRVGVASPSSDYLNVAYDAWPLPAYAPLPGVGQFFDVYVQSITNPSNFVVSVMIIIVMSS